MLRLPYWGLVDQMLSRRVFIATYRRIQTEGSMHKGTVDDTPCTNLTVLSGIKTSYFRKQTSMILYKLKSSSRINNVA